MMNHLIIPDTQVKPGVPLEHLDWIGRYIAHKRPDVVIHLGDHFDLPSLSSYDKGTLAHEGRKLAEDIAAGHEGLRRLTTPIHRMRDYYPRLVYIPGNHDERITRIAHASPELEGVIGWESLGIEAFGWERANYLEPVDIDGILYSHYFANPLTGRAYSGSAAAMLKTLGRSFVMGHRQVLDFSTRMLIDGNQQIGIIAGACYLHEEGYKGPQGNKHWRGIVMLHDVHDGFGNPMFVDLPYLERKYGEATKATVPRRQAKRRDAKGNAGSGADAKGHNPKAKCGGAGTDNEGSGVVYATSPGAAHRVDARLFGWQDGPDAA